MSEVMIFSTSMSSKLSLKNVFDELQSDYTNNVQHRPLIEQFVNNLSVLGKCLHPIDAYNLRRVFSSIYGVELLTFEPPPFLYHGEDVLRSDGIYVLHDVMMQIHKRDTLSMTYLMMYVVSQGFIKCFRLIRDNTCGLNYLLLTNYESIVDLSISSGNIELFNEVYETYYYDHCLSTDQRYTESLTDDDIRNDNIPALMRFMRTAFIFNRAGILRWLIDECQFLLNISPSKIELYLRTTSTKALNEGFYACPWRVLSSTHLS